MPDDQLVQSQGERHRQPRAEHPRPQRLRVPLPSAREPTGPSMAQPGLVDVASVFGACELVAVVGLVQ